ncbi:MAG: MqnA/MqnD/SBP family protein [Pirellulaceae bacterium]
MSGKQGIKSADRSQRTLCPGKHTTAAMLFELFYPNTTRVDHVVFSQIMPKLQQGADFGVCILKGVSLGAIKGWTW